MTNNILQGITLVVTRPEHQAGGLCKKLEELGASIIRFPLIKIQMQESDPLAAKGKDIRQFQYLIFVSRNAVDAAVRIWPEYPDIFKGKKIVAIGSASRDTLMSKGINDVTHCPGKASSEHLLQLKAFDVDQIQGQSVLILRGNGGRELLGQILIERGAKLEYAELYKRLKPCYDEQQISRVWQNGKGQPFIILTSGEALENLIAIMQADYSNELLNSPLLVISERVAEQAKQSGFKGSVLVAETSNDDGLINALVKSLNEEK